MIILASLFSCSLYSMQEEPHQRKPQPQLMEAMEQLPNPNIMIEHEGTATSLDRTIGCCMVLSIPCLMISLCVYDKIKHMMNW